MIKFVCFFRLRIVVLVLLFTIASGLVGCLNSDNSVDEDTVVAMTPTPTLFSAVVEILPSPTQTITFKPSPSSTPNPTSTLIPTGTPIPTMTLTPLPTISPDQVEEYIQNLYQTNSECLLPCWWGAVPGQTHWQEVQPFLESFAEISTRGGGEPKLYSVQIYIPEKENPSKTYGGGYTVRNKIIESIQTGINTDELHYYVLPKILETYGQPDEIWISTYAQSREGVLPFSLTVVYADGIVITYRIYDAMTQLDQVEGCFNQSDILLWLVSPERNITFSEARQKTSQIDNSQQHLTLQEATGLDIETFYESFKDSNSNQCLQTPASIWHLP